MPIELTPEQASKGGQRSAELRRLQREDPEGYIRERAQSERAELFKQLLNAAYGRGRWDNLSPDKQLQALFKALEYSAGKPSAGKAVGDAAAPVDDAGIEVA